MEQTENLNQNLADSKLIDSQSDSQNNITKENHKKTNLTFTEKIKLFSKNNFDFIVSGSLIFLIYTLTLIFNKCIPFGKNTIIFSDAQEQIASFFDHIFNVFEGKSTIFYTNYFGKGISIFSTILYMLTNPFYLTVIIGGRSNIDLMLTFSILFMLIFNSIIFNYFTRKYFKNINKYYRVLLSILFVFSTFLNYNIAFISWLIYPALLLLLIDKFIIYLKTGKIKGLIIIYSWYIINCFSVGISTSLLLLLISTLYIFLCIDKAERYKKLTGLFVSIISTALICLIILFPAVLDYLFTDRSNSDSILKSLLVVSFFSPINKLGLIFSSLAILIFTIFYFIKCNRKEKFNKFLLITCLLLFLPVIFDAMMKLLCFASYKGFCGRFYFLNETFLFLISLSIFNKGFNFKECLDKKQIKIIYIILLSIFSLGVVIALIFLINDASASIKIPTSRSNAVTLLTFTIFLLLSAIFLTTLILNYKEKISKLLSKIAVIIILTLSIITNCLLFSFNCHGNYSDNEEIFKLANSSNLTGNFKVTNSSASKNNYNFYSENLRNTNVFTSLISNKTLEPNITLGYYAGDVLVQNSTGNLIADSILGINYYISDKKLERPYLTEILKSENYYLYENKLSTTGAFKLSSNFSFDYEESFTEIFENLKNHFEIDGTLFEEITIPLTQLVGSDNEINYIGEYTPNHSGILYFQSYFFYEDKEENSEREKFNISVSTDYAMQDVSFINANETFKFNLINQDESEIKALFLNYEIAEKICQKLKENQVKFSYTKDGYNINLSSINENESIYVSVPNIDGLNYTINGQEIQANEFLGGFTKFTPNSTIFLENPLTIEAKFKYPNSKIWIISSIIFLIILITILLLYHYTKFKIFEKLIGFGMVGLCAIIVMLVYFLGILLAICDISFQIINFFS